MIYNSEELETFSEKQLSELAMYASIDQFNIISRLERKYHMLEKIVEKANAA